MCIDTCRKARGTYTLLVTFVDNAGAYNQHDAEGLLSYGR